MPLFPEPEDPDFPLLPLEDEPELEPQAGASQPPQLSPLLLDPEEPLLPLDDPDPPDFPLFPLEELEEGPDHEGGGPQ